MRPLLACVLAAVFAAPCAAAEWSPYYERTPFLLAPASVWGEGLVGFAQPATLTFQKRPEAQFHWSTPAGKVSGFEDWMVAAGVPHLGFAMQSRHRAGVTSIDHAISASGGTQGLAFGVQYGFGGGDEAPQNTIAAGAVWRPGSRLSLATTGRYGVDGPEYEWVTEAGLRPLGDRRLTIFADLAWQSRTQIGDAPWSAGAAFGVLRGVDLVGRVFDGGAFTVGLSVNFGQAGVTGQSHVNADEEFSHQSWSVRMGGLKPGFATGRRARGRHYVALHPKGRVRYLRYRFFDESSPRLYELLTDIRAAAADHRVATLAINLSDVRLSPEHAWEVRVALDSARAHGKEVLVYIDHAGMTAYHVASVADRVIMDPYGMLSLPGYALNKTYFRGTLDKLGLGFDEWRYRRYKSALEVLVREGMSDADREQSQAFVDDWYETTARDVCASRGFTPAEFDRLVDEGALFTADSALAAGLVDTLARWSDVSSLVRARAGRRLIALAPRQLLERAEVTDDWGEVPRIALVYGLGVCDMDQGIKARSLERLFDALARDRRVRAVVFRIDSPGGDPLAADLVMRAVERCSQRKPVIVSQGQVAASGGYALSLAGDTVLSGPNTVTGSIGVIGGWLYDQGATSKLGMTSDVVKRGRHADFDAGARMPFLGVRLPRRQLSDTKVARVHLVMNNLYNKFVQGVAEFRKLSPDSVHRLAEGRIYSGLDAKSVGLVDDLGGLLLALDLASARAGLEQGQRTNVVEYPGSAGWFAWPWKVPNVASVVPGEVWEETLQLISEFNGQPLLLLSPGSYPEDD